jgi:hypothetical protein
MEILNFSHFSRIDFSYNQIEELDICKEELIPNLIKQIPEFITPPISINESNLFSSFVATKSNSFKLSKERLSEILQKLRNHNFKVLRPTQKGLL